MISAKMRRTGHSSYSITRDRGAPEVADSGGPPAMGRWAGGASPPLVPDSFVDAESLSGIREHWLIFSNVSLLKN